MEWPENKRCPKNTVRNQKTKKCDPVNAEKAAKRKAATASRKSEKEKSPLKPDVKKSESKKPDSPIIVKKSESKKPDSPIIVKKSSVIKEEFPTSLKMLRVFSDGFNSYQLPMLEELKQIKLLVDQDDGFPTIITVNHLQTALLLIMFKHEDLTHEINNAIKHANRYFMDDRKPKSNAKSVLESFFNGKIIPTDESLVYLSGLMDAGVV